MKRTVLLLALLPSLALGQGLSGGFSGPAGAEGSGWFSGLKTLAPTASPASGTFSGGTTVSLSSGPDAVIRYTLDGTPATSNSTAYTLPFLLTDTATVNVWAQSPGRKANTGSAAYTITAPLSDSLPFTTPGCYNSGTVVGTGTVLQTRAGSRYCPISTGDLTCSANQFCVSDLACGAGVTGLLLEPTRTQLYPTPTAPASGTVTFAATGAHIFSVTGTGSQALSASGTLVATGLPCTATAAAPCSFTVTTLGATPTGALASVTGSLTRGQIEKGAYISTFMPTAGAWNGDVPRFVWSLNGQASSWCIEETLTPISGSAWANVDTMFNVQTGYPSAQTYVQSATDYRFVVYSSSQQLNVDTTAMIPAGTHRVRTCDKSTGHSAIFVDGGLVKTSYSGAGTGVMGTLPSTIYIGNRASATAVFGGCMSNFQVRTATGLPDWATARLYYLGDSIYNGSQLWNDVEFWASTEGTLYPITHDTATCNGHTVGLGLLELSKAYAYETGAWSSLKTRGVPFASQTHVLWDFGANDAGQLTVDQYRQGYDKLVDLSRSAGLKTCAGTPLPHSNDMVSWNAAPYEFGGSAGFYAAAQAVWSKWNVTHYDLIPYFRSLVASGLYTVAQLSADGTHGTVAGSNEEGHAIAQCLSSAAVPSANTPEIVGDAVTEFFGVPGHVGGGGGSWSRTTKNPTISCNTPGQSYRIANYTNTTEQAIESSTLNDSLTFRAYTMSANSQIWVRFFLHASPSTGGGFRWYIDKGTGGEITGTIGTLYPAGNDGAVLSKLLAGGLSAGSHSVEIDINDASGPVTIMGVTYVGVTAGP